MTLVEGEYIEQIEELDDDWWSGVGPGGKTGLFPGQTPTLSIRSQLTDLASSQLC